MWNTIVLFFIVNYLTLENNLFRQKSKKMWQKNETMHNPSSELTLCMTLKIDNKQPTCHLIINHYC